MYAKLALGRNETGFGLLMSSMGIGSLIGAFLTATRRKEKINLNLLFKFILSVSLVYILLGINKSYKVACVLFVLVGLLAISFNTSANALLQLSSSDEFRARVLSIYFLCNAGTTPIGNLFTGTISQKISPWAGFYISGLVTIVLTTMVLITTFKRKSLEKTK
ncbi:MFS transporter [Caldicellulosiruptor naganoensis]|uniref:MFS transporter n=1 Tax=Caldicellulosiruptor naganoensis TaxID=29324 RepID=A0ABY7BGC5_9FIRM|nr:MFS transporter [Caldicellulosiruptor naganoensis]WAM31893.1 MFS transporter [Caldicellulosiruptor naganoensis]